MTNEAKASVVIWWVDDDFLDAKSDNLRLFKRLEKYDEFRLKKFTPNDFLDTIRSNTKAPDLFLVDYKLNQKPDPNHDNKPFPYTGTGLVGVIRDKFPEHPIYLISRLLHGKEASCNNDLFDRLMNYDWFTERAQKTAKSVLQYDAEDYRRIRNIRKRDSFAAICRLLVTPKQLCNSLKLAAPDSLHNGIGIPPHLTPSEENLTFRRSGVIALAEWTRKYLIRHPGLLYNDLFAATYLGMKKTYFNEIFAPQLETTNASLNPLYQGIFSRSEDRRWWKRTLSDYLFSLPEAENHSVENAWIAGPIILNLADKNRARCIVCGKLSPETVAYDPDDRDESFPVHWRCSEPDPESKLLAIYDETRLIRE